MAKYYAEAAVTAHDYELLEELKKRAVEVKLDAVEGTSAKLLKAASHKRQADDRQSPDAGPAMIRDLVALRGDLAGLPMRGASECTLSEEAAESAEEISSIAQFTLARRRRVDVNAVSDPIRAAPTDQDQKFIESFRTRFDEVKSDAASVLAQVLWVESPVIRNRLTNVLASIRGEQAGAALMRQALFDVSPAVREAAVHALDPRPGTEYRDALLAAFRHPWPPIAERAAAAVQVLDARDLARPLAEMLDLPDPSAPVYDENRGWVKAELVKVNHLSNCLLCHAPSTDEKDHVRGFIPKPGEPIPLLYYEQPKGDFVRADVTYLRQDFSVMEPVKDHGKWPAMQRYDYLVRRRPLTDQEMIDLADLGPPSADSYPQREAVLSALRGLTGMDVGDSSEAWLQLLSEREAAGSP